MARTPKDPINDAATPVLIGVDLARQPDVAPDDPPAPPPPGPGSWVWDPATRTHSRAPKPAPAAPVTERT